ncbi:MAG: endonuclease [Paenibacillaceae bacterium]|jgi:endonuclease/exonuclease/phosphatase family metal-dependent hydrolase|nr:endonuclease [Paenibacillaceae bacterium]
MDLHRSWIFRRESAALTISLQKPWLVGTQEGTACMLRDLDRLLPEYGRVGTGRGPGGKGEHNAIYFHSKKLKLIDWGQLWLSETPEQPGSIGWDARFPRICTWARMSLLQEQGTAIMVYNTHLDHVGQEARIRGVQLIWQIIQQHQEQFGPSPVLLSGDFNAGPGHPAIRFLSGDEEEHDGPQAPLCNAFADPRHAGSTFHGFLGGKKGEPIDFLFGGFGLMPEHGDVIRSKYGGQFPSDHYPVTAVFKLRSANRQGCRPNR